MQIKEAKIYNFGKLQNQSVSFEPGINVIYGKNEAGKSTLHEFLIAMLFGMEKGRGRAAAGESYSQYEPWHAPSYYSGALRFEVGGQPFYLERNFYVKEKTELLRNEADGEELSVAYGDLTMLLGGIGKETFGNTYDIPQSGAATGAAMSGLLSEYLSDAANGGAGSVHVTKAVTALNARKKELLQQQKKAGEEKKEQIRQLQMEERILEEDREELLKSIREFETKQNTLKKELREMQDASQFLEKQETSKILEKQKTEKLEAGGSGMEWQQRNNNSHNNSHNDSHNNNHNSSTKYLLRLLAVIGAVISGLLFYFSQISNGVLFGLETICAAILILSIFSKKRREEAEPEQVMAEEKSDQFDAGLQESMDTRQTAINTTLQMADHAGSMLGKMKDSLQEKENRLFNIREEKENLMANSESERRMQEDIEALELAAVQIEGLAKEYYEDVEDELNGEISRWVSAFTNEKYDSVRLDTNGKILVQTEAREVAPEQLSRGTKEQIYLALRMAVGSIVTREESLPVFFDETFAMYDDERLAETLRVLAATKKQILIFTCQRREAQTLEELGIKYHPIFL